MILDPEGPPPLRILVADDDPVIVDSLSKILSQRGFEVLAVYDGCSALLVLEDFRPNLALLDHQMPGVTGTEVARVLQKLCPYCTVYILSSYVGFNLPDEGNSVSGIGYLRKPIHPSHLLAILES